MATVITRIRHNNREFHRVATLHHRNLRHMVSNSKEEHTHTIKEDTTVNLKLHTLSNKLVMVRCLKPSPPATLQLEVLLLLPPLTLSRCTALHPKSLLET